MPKVVEHRDSIAEACRELGVERLDVFGPATRTDFGLQSDVDGVARFDRSRKHMLAHCFELKERLEKLFQRPVDLLLDDAIRNPYLGEIIDTSGETIYQALLPLEGVSGGLKK